MIDLELFKKILEADNGFIDHTDFFDHKTIEWFAAYNQATVRTLFKPQTTKNTHAIPKFRFEVKCPDCGSIREIQGAKSRLLDYINYRKTSYFRKSSSLRFCDGLTCEPCLVAKARKAAEEKAERDAYIQTAEELTDYFIRNYANPAKRWSDEVTLYDAFRSMQNKLLRCNSEAIAKHIKGLDYSDFLKTPYWKAVAREVYRRADFRCSICGASGTLNAHHRDYSIHGYEVQNIKDMICLCKPCHETFHFARKVA